MLAPNWLGDLVMALPAMWAIQRHVGGRCAVVARERVREVAEVLGAEVVGTGPSLVETGRTAAWLRRRRPRVVVSFLRTRRAGLLAWVSGAGVRVGWDAGPARRCYTLRAPSDRKRIHQTEEYMRLAQALGAPPSLTWPPPQGWCPRQGPPCVVMAPGASFGPAKRWPAERFGLLGKALAARSGLPVVLVGTAQEREACERVASLVGLGASSLAGTTTLRDLAGLLRGARLFVGNDSGVAHLAAWMGTPTVAIFGSTDPRWTRPVGQRVEVVSSGVPCSPCFQRKCPWGRPECLEGITVERVLESCARLLDSS